MTAVRHWWQKTLFVRRDIEGMSRITGCILTDIPFWKVSTRVNGVIKGKYRPDYESSATVDMIYRFRRHMIWSRVVSGPRSDGIDILPETEGMAVADGQNPWNEVPCDLRRDHVTAACLKAIEESLLDSAYMDGGITVQEIHYNDTRTWRIEYPVRVVEYICEEQAYSAVVDGMTGSVLYCRAPISLRDRVIVTGFLALFYASVPVFILTWGWTSAAVPMVAIIISSGYIQDGVAIARYGLLTGTMGRVIYRPVLNRIQNDSFQGLCYLLGILSFILSFFLMGSNSPAARLAFGCGYVSFLAAALLTPDTMKVKNKPLRIDETMPGSFAERKQVGA